METLLADTDAGKILYFMGSVRAIGYEGGIADSKVAEKVGLPKERFDFAVKRLYDADLIEKDVVGNETEATENTPGYLYLTYEGSEAALSLIPSR